jgi:hypothetical protein
MAGFVLSDPRFTKNPDLKGQREALLAASGATKQYAPEGSATETALYISEARRKYLAGEHPTMKHSKNQTFIKLETQFSHDEIMYSSELPRTDPKQVRLKELDQVTSAPRQGRMYFLLRRAHDAPGQGAEDLWSVNYCPGAIGGPPKVNSDGTFTASPTHGRKEVKLSNNLRSPNEGGILPVMAVVDPLCASDVRNTYRAATTGDYDLFALFPPVATGKNFPIGYNRNAGGLDARVVPNSDRFRVPVVDKHKFLIDTYQKYEDQDLGNMTPRLVYVRHLLNDAVKGKGYRGGDVVHHSDEAGRPKVHDIDFPFIAFIPDKTEAYLAQNLADFKSLISMVIKTHQITFNPGWQQQFGFSTTIRGSYEV